MTQKSRITEDVARVRVGVCVRVGVRVCVRVCVGLRRLEHLKMCA